MNGLDSSLSLVSSPDPKTSLRDRVQRAVEETGFTPNAYALHLKGKRTSTVGVCMENLLTPPALQKLSALQRLLRAHHHTTLIEVLEPGQSRNVVRHFLSMRVDAVVFIGHFIEEEIAQRVIELTHHDTPHLLIDQLGVTNATSVTLDRARGMADLTRHLLELGHTSFGLLGISGVIRSLRDRLAGIEEALAGRGLTMEQATRTLDHRHVRDNDFEYGRALARSFAGEKKMPTAFVALNDEIAIGAMHGFQEEGMRVPKDVSIAGFNNQDICLMTTPRLTSIDQQVLATVEAGAEVLLAQIGQPLRRRPAVRMIQPRLVVRDSTAAAR